MSGGSSKSFSIITSLYCELYLLLRRNARALSIRSYFRAAKMLPMNAATKKMGTIMPPKICCAPGSIFFFMTGSSTAGFVTFGFLVWLSWWVGFIVVGFIVLVVVLDLGTCVVEVVVTAFTVVDVFGISVVLVVVFGASVVMFVTSFLQYFAAFPAFWKLLKSSFILDKHKINLWYIQTFLNWLWVYLERLHTHA